MDRRETELRRYRTTALHALLSGPAATLGALADSGYARSICAGADMVGRQMVRLLEGRKAQARCEEEQEATVYEISVWLRKIDARGMETGVLLQRILAARSEGEVVRAAVDWAPKQLEGAPDMEAIGTVSAYECRIGSYDFEKHEARDDRRKLFEWRSDYPYTLREAVEVRELSRVAEGVS